MPIGYHPDFGTDVRYEFQTLPDDPDGQVRETMRTLRRYLRHDAGLPFFQQHARSIDTASDPDLFGLAAHQKVDAIPAGRGHSGPAAG